MTGADGYHGQETAELAQYEAQLRNSYPQGVDLAPPTAGHQPNPNIAAPPAPAQDPGMAQPQPAPGPQPGQNGQFGTPPSRQQAMPIPRYDPPPDPIRDVQQPQPQPGPGPQHVQFGPHQQRVPGGHPAQGAQPGPGQPAAPVAAVLDERRRRQEAEGRERQLQAALTQVQEQQARMDERVAMLAGSVTRGQESQIDALRGQDIPSFDVDPERHIQAVNELAVKRQEERLAKKIDELEAKQKQHDEVIQAETVDRQIRQAFQSQAAMFEQRVPDFQQAYDFMIASRKRELIDQGFPPEQVTRFVDDEEKMLAQGHLANNRDVPEAFYRAALARGYVPAHMRGQQPARPGYQNAQQNIPQNIPQQQQPASYYPLPLPAPGPQQMQQRPQAQAAMPQQQQPMYQMPQYQAPPALPAPMPDPMQYQQMQPAYMPMPSPAAQPQMTYYAGQPSLDNMQAGMMAGAHLADTGGEGFGPGDMMPTLDQLYNMNEEQLAANHGVVNAHIDGLIAAGH